LSATENVGSHEPFITRRINHPICNPIDLSHRWLPARCAPFRGRRARPQWPARLTNAFAAVHETLTRAETMADDPPENPRRNLPTRAKTSYRTDSFPREQARPRHDLGSSKRSATSEASVSREFDRMGLSFVDPVGRDQTLYAGYIGGLTARICWPRPEPRRPSRANNLVEHAALHRRSGQPAETQVRSITWRDVREAAKRSQANSASLRSGKSTTVPRCRARPSFIADPTSGVLGLHLRSGSKALVTWGAN